MMSQNMPATVGCGFYVVEKAESLGFCGIV